MNDTEIWVLIAAAVVALLFLSLVALGWLIAGAVVLFTWALTQGFIGAAIYFALWIFALPFMLIASIIVGGVCQRIQARDEKNAKQIKAWRKKNLGDESEPPSDPYERSKWANRLPPYDR